MEGIYRFPSNVSVMELHFRKGRRLQPRRLSEPILILCAVIFGVIVAGLALNAGYEAAKTSVMMAPQRNTARAISYKMREIEAYRKAHHALSRSLEQLNNLEDWHEPEVVNGVKADDKLSNEPDRDTSDGWLNPYIYTVQGKRYTLLSYGRDGKPGGNGLDADLSSDNLHPANGGLSFREFLKNSDTQGMAITACCCGLAAAALGYFLFRSVAISPRNLPAIALGLLALLAVTVFVTAIITVLHIPSGH